MAQDAFSRAGTNVSQFAEGEPLLKSVDQRLEADGEHAWQPRRTVQEKRGPSLVIQDSDLDFGSRGSSQYWPAVARYDRPYPQRGSATARRHGSRTDPFRGAYVRSASPQDGQAYLSAESVP